MITLSELKPLVRQYFATAVIALCLMSDGMQFGWQSPANKYLQSNESTIKGYNDDIDLANQIVFLVGGIGVSPLVTFLADKIGRKWTSIVGSGLNVISWISIGFTPYAIVLVFSKLLASISYCFDMVILPMYVSEISEKRIRGFLLAYIYMSAMLGIIVIYAIFPFMPVLASSAVGAALNGIHIIVIIFMPESPYYLFKKKKTEAAAKSLQYFRGDQDISEEMKHIEESLATQDAQNTKLIELFKDDHTRKALTIGCVLQFMVPFGALSMITMNLHTLLGDDRVIFPEDYTSIGFAMTLFLSQILVMCIIDYFGRKPLLLLSVIGCNFTLLTFAVYFTIRDLHPHNDYSAVMWIPEITIILYALCYRLGLGTVPATLCAEMFPTKHKPIGLTIAFVVLTIFDAVVVVIYKQFNRYMEPYYTFYIFASVSLLNVPFVLLFVPETKGKTLEEIQEILGKGWLRKWKQDQPEQKQ